MLKTKALIRAQPERRVNTIFLEDVSKNDKFKNSNDKNKSKCQMTNFKTMFYHLLFVLCNYFGFCALSFVIKLLIMLVRKLFSGCLLLSLRGFRPSPGSAGEALFYAPGRGEPIPLYRRGLRNPSR